MKNVMTVLMVFSVVSMNSFASDGPKHEKKEQSQSNGTEKCSCCSKEAKSCYDHQKEKNGETEQEVKQSGVKLVK